MDFQNDEIVLLTDYRNTFGSKYNALPYRSGMDISKLQYYFKENNIRVNVLSFNKVLYNDPYFKNRIVVYTSSEDINYYYKDYIEDVILGLKNSGALIIPDFEFLRANNNKVFMEILRNKYASKCPEINLKTNIYGTLEDLKADLLKFNYPVVLKEPQGAMSDGVFLAKNCSQLLKKVKKISKTKTIKEFLREEIRHYIHKGYSKQSLHRNKFIVQEFLPGLRNDWKVLVFGSKYYIFFRPNRKNDFRASGSGNKSYLYGSACPIPDGIFDYAQKIYHCLKVPTLSIDIAFSQGKFSLLEFQAVYFGSVGQVKSDGYFINRNRKWIFKKEKVELESLYCTSLLEFLENENFIRLQRP